MNALKRKDDPVAPAEIGSKSDAPARSVAVIDNRLDSSDLFVATREIIIRHGDGQYRLRLTSQNKLILTK